MDTRRWRCGRPLPKARKKPSTAEEVFGEEEDVGGAFGEATHEVGVPLGAEGDVDADAVALRDELALQIAADAVEHLKLEGGFFDTVDFDEVAEVVDDGLVVRSHATEDAAGNQLLRNVKIVGIDVGLGGEGDLGGFLVGTFAEADADSLLGE